jgi:hypothetical protein
MNTDTGTDPVLSKKWAWFERIAHAKQSVFVSRINSARRFTKFNRSSSDLNIFRRSIPLMIT